MLKTRRLDGIQLERFSKGSRCSSKKLFLKIWQISQEIIIKLLIREKQILRSREISMLHYIGSTFRDSF